MGQTPNSALLNTGFQRTLDDVGHAMRCGILIRQQIVPARNRTLLDWNDA